ncbi:hypothetical protein C0993_007727 [Termitomyces sp. T159_Od127]|nr:hypothetical protein C0993_007727 [Termitomyces sp. T159_Od127]
MAAILRGRLRSLPANGHAAFLPQIRKLVFECCDRWPSSETTRTYLFSRLVGLARDNPHVEVVVRQRVHREPIVRGFYGAWGVHLCSPTDGDGSEQPGQGGAIERAVGGGNQPKSAPAAGRVGGEDQAAEAADGGEHDRGSAGDLERATRGATRVLSIDELRWLHASEAIVDDAPPPRARTLDRTSQRHRHCHLLDHSTVAPPPRRPSPSLIPAPVRPAPHPVPTEWLYRSPKRPAPAPRPRTRSTSRPLATRPVHSVLPKPLSAKDKDKERSIWAMLRLPDKPRDDKRALAIVIGRARNRASSASSNSTTASSASARSAESPATSPSPSVPASPPTKSILSPSASASSRPAPQRSLAALFSRGPSTGSVTSSVKSVTFVDEPTVHYPDDFDTESDDDRLHLDDDAGLSNGALAWEMGLDIDTMDLDLSLELDVPPTVNLDAPLELDMGQKYVPPKRDEIAGILEEDEDAEDDPAPKKDPLKRFWSLGASPPKTERKLKRRSAPLPARPTISGPFALGSSPPTHFFPPPPTLHPSASRSSASLRSQARSGTSSTSTLRARARSNSNSTTDTLPVQPRAACSAPPTPVRTTRPHPHPHPRRPRTAPPTASASPASTTASLAPRCGPYAYAASLHTAPSLESFRSAAGRSVRSLGSIKSTASARSAIRALLGKIGIGVGGAAEGAV